MFPRPAFFDGARLNFAENLLYPTNVNIDASSPAVISATETTRETISWASLRQRVQDCTSAMRALDIQPHDRIAGFLGNHVNTLVAMLAAASIGAIWTGVSPDTGVRAVLDRLVQIEPVLLFADNAVMYNGKVHGAMDKVEQIVSGLEKLRGVVVFETVSGYEVELERLRVGERQAWVYKDFLK